MHHFFVQDKPSGEKIILTGSDVNHIRNVLRMKPGERLLISCLDGPDYICVLKELTSEQVTAEIIETDVVGRELPAKLHLFQGLPKSDKMEFIIQKAVELGAVEIIPTAMQNCVVKLDDKKGEAKRKRWEGIAESAAKQSKRSLIPDIHPVMNYREAIEYAAGMDLVLVPYECTEGMKATKEAFAGVKPGIEIGIFIGPEGGLDVKEIELAIQKGAVPISLGRRILRTETAGLAVLAALMLQLEMQSE